METDAKPGEEFTQGADEDLLPDQREYILAPRSVGVLTGKLAGDLLRKMNIIGHLKTITKHHNLVMGYCLRAGLIRQGLFHDLSKLSPTEFWVGQNITRDAEPEQCRA